MIYELSFIYNTFQDRDGIQALYGIRFPSRGIYTTSTRRTTTTTPEKNQQ